jgi:hypothetical protein
MLANKEEPLTEREIRALIEGIVTVGDTGYIPDFTFLNSSPNISLVIKNLVAQSASNAELISNVLYLGYKLGRLAAKKEALKDYVELSKL